MINYNDKKDGFDTCPHCQGQGKVLIDEIKLFEICEKCNGDGGFTWLEIVLGKERYAVSRAYQQQRDNLERLRYYLDSYARILGFQAKIEFIPCHEYNCKHEPNALPKNTFEYPAISHVFGKIEW